MDSKVEFEFVDFTRHSRAHGPADHQKNEVAAPVPRRSSAPYPTKSKSRASDYAGEILAIAVVAALVVAAGLVS